MHCEGCEYYDQVEERILIVKLGAAGDVIRTTPLLRRLKSEFPASHITWLSDFPELLPATVDRKVRLNERTLTWLRTCEFDIAYVLDKDPEAISLAERVSATVKFGFGMDRWGNAVALNAEAESKILTGVFDDVSQANEKSYPEEIFELCGYEFQGETYELDHERHNEWKLDQPHPLIGLNTGAGGRWPSRLWPEEYWVELGKQLHSRGYGVLWLGGPEEDERNKRLSAQGVGSYLGHFPLPDFVDLVAQTDVLVTQVTMAMHIGLGMGRRLVLMNNIFNASEFEMYGLGKIVEPDPPCDCYYNPVCPHDSMRNITPERIAQAVSEEVDKLS